VETFVRTKQLFPALPGMSKIFLAIIVIGIGTLIGLFVFAALTL
jgi:hypothetical protein